MLALFIALLGSLGVSLVLTPIARGVGRRHGLLDVADNIRKIHGRPIPRLGGVAIVAGTYLSASCAIAVMPNGMEILGDLPRALGLILAGGAVALLGLYDDICGATAGKKLAVQFGAAALLYAVGFRIDAVANPLGGEVRLGLLSLPVTLLWIAGVSNAINLIDGLDGLAGGISVAAALVALAIGVHSGDRLTTLLSVAIIGSVLGFLAYNLHPASIFMGDTGSLFLGTALAVLPLLPRQGGSTPVPLIAMIMALGIPIADTLLAMARRAGRGAPVFGADRKHIHHRLLDHGLSHDRAVLWLWGAAGALCLAATYVALEGTYWAIVVLVVVACASILLNRLGALRLPDRSFLSRRQRSLERLRAVRRAGKAFPRGTASQEVRARSGTRA